jgi:hypothetical protein
LTEKKILDTIVLAFDFGKLDSEPK